MKFGLEEPTGVSRPPSALAIFDLCRCRDDPETAVHFLNFGNKSFRIGGTHLACRYEVFRICGRFKYWFYVFNLVWFTQKIQQLWGVHLRHAPPFKNSRAASSETIDRIRKKLVMCKRIRAASVNMVSMVALRLRTPSTVKSWICVSIWLSVGRFLNGQSDANGKRPRRPKY